MSSVNQWKGNKVLAYDMIRGYQGRFSIMTSILTPTEAFLTVMIFLLTFLYHINLVIPVCAKQL